MKKILIKIILSFLIKTLKVLYKYDVDMKNIVKGINMPLFVTINILGTDISKSFVVHNKGIEKCIAANIKNIMIIEFKHINAAFRAFTGKISLKQCYIDKLFTLKGSILDGMRIMEAVNLTESYLLPRFICVKLFDYLPKRNCGKLMILSKVIL